ncbi:MAG: DUF4258 domain-containing protein [Candidatus Acidiferrum sp.]
MRGKANLQRPTHLARRKVVYYQVAVERLSRHEAVKLLRECLRIGKIIPGKHFRDELAAEGLILPDALRVLKTGNIFHEPKCDPKTGDWKYRVEGKEVGGKWLAIVFCFWATDTAFLITVFSVEVKRK